MGDLTLFPRQKICGQVYQWGACLRLKASGESRLDVDQHVQQCLNRTV